VASWGAGHGVSEDGRWFVREMDTIKRSNTIFSTSTRTVSHKSMPNFLGQRIPLAFRMHSEAPLGNDGAGDRAFDLLGDDKVSSRFQTICY
jgi:hypothetical protein